VAFANGNIVYPEFAYPLRKEIVPIWAAALLAALVPIFIILIMQIRIRSLWDVNNAILGLLYSLITAAVFQVMLKCLIGGLRPHFLAVCDPDVLPFGQQAGTGWTQIMYDRSICRGDKHKIDDSLESFPSGTLDRCFRRFRLLVPVPQRQAESLRQLPPVLLETHRGLHARARRDAHRGRSHDRRVPQLVRRRRWRYHRDRDGRECLPHGLRKRVGFPLQPRARREKCGFRLWRGAERLRGFQRSCRYEEIWLGSSRGACLRWRAI
jgi:hypothetical protein